MQQEWIVNWLRTAAPLRVTMVGPPGSGKGTHGSTLAERHRAPYVDMGSVLRAEVARDTVVGKAVKRYMDRGEIAPDGMTMGIVFDALSDPVPLPAFVLDGVPRRTTQAIALDSWLDSVGLPLQAAVFLDVPQEELMSRLLARGRPDDKVDIIRNRFEEYEEETAPMVDYYRRTGRLLEIDATGELEEIARRIESSLAQLVGTSAMQ